MDGNSDPAVGVAGGSEGQIGQREDSAAVNHAEAVEVMIAKRQTGGGPPILRLDEFDTDKCRKCGKKPGGK